MLTSWQYIGTNVNEIVHVAMAVTVESNMCSYITSPPQVMYLLFHCIYSSKAKATWENNSFWPCCLLSYVPQAVRSRRSHGCWVTLRLPPSCRSETAIPSLHCFTSASPDVTQASLSTETTKPFRTPLAYTPLPPPAGTPPTPTNCSHSPSGWRYRREKTENLQM